MKAMADRQYYIDWLRAGAMFFLVFYHTGRLFDLEPWHIKSLESSFAIHVFNRTLDVWQMPLFFLLAGASVWFSLSKRSPREFAWERFLRLFVPLIFGSLIIVPPQVYFERVLYGDFSGSFLAWYPNTFHGIYQEGSADGNFHWSHLWFLAYLFVFSIILLPLFWYLRSEDKNSLISRITNFLARPGAIFLPAVPLIIYNITLRPIYGYGHHSLISDWANFLFYITVFFCGFLIVADSRITQVVHKNRFTALFAAIVCTVIIYLLETDTIVLPQAIAGKGWIILLTLYAIDSWLCLIAIMGIGRQLLNFTNRVLRYSADAVLPVYILHQTIIIALGFYVIQWDMPVVAKYFLVAIATLLSSVGIYEIVRRTSVTRVLFGIKARKRPVLVQTPATSS